MSSTHSQSVVRSTVADSWRWLWPDIFMRLIPMGAIPFIYIVIRHLPLTALGLTLHDVPQQLLLGVGIGSGMALFAALYRMLFVGPWFRWPTRSDHLLQSLYYLVLNGPIEELFFRGFLLTAVAQWTGWLGWGWLVSTATYTLYHRLGKWNWRSVGGVGLAGLVFSSLYLAQPEPRSLLAVVIVHGFTTCGFLNWGDELLYRRWKRRQRTNHTSTSVPIPSERARL
ncbi:MAG: CPBP family intramembrane glutamic endopeptidase [Ktedonobacteraceae bacterium]|nr:CPBP family intramembrane metalloprotease [Chloroflexota bacterium]